MTLDPVLQIFFDEAEELLRTFEDGVLGLEVAPQDRELLHSVFRAAHTLKGNSSMLGFERIATVTHALEELLVRLRAGESAPGREVVDTLLSANDVLRLLVSRARAGDESDVPGVGELVDRLADHAQSMGHPAAAPASRPSVPAVGREVLYEVTFVPPADLLRRGLDPLRLLTALGELGEIERVQGNASTLPPLAALDPETAYLGFSCWLRSRCTRADIEAGFDFVDEPGALRITVVDGELAVEEPVVEPAAPALASAAERLRWASEQETQSIRVATDKVDRLVDLVGELVITQSMVAQIVHRLGQGAAAETLPALVEAVAQMDRHTRDLEERVMAIRMLPIRTVFGRFSRVVRDLARALGKRVSFETHGDETELDKTVIERIGDPLMHLVRNAVDHGIESPTDRRAQGKPEMGRLTLAAYQQGGNIYIEIQDDGRGLDRARILRKAAEVGLVASADEGLTDEQVYALIFQPGFSTAEQVTEVSGRGVGMDVVKRNVEALGGSISTQSVPRRGTTFRVKLPLTLAILEGQSLRVGEHVYILPLATITESVRPSMDTLRTLFGSREAFIMRGEVVPFVRLHRLFRVPRAEEDPTRGLTVVVEHDGRRVALLVDELLGQQQFVIKSLESNFQRVDGVAGATILGDGRVALILDVPGLVALSRAA